MTESPFFDIPRAEWIAANRSAFAVWDAYPVSPGHALVVSRRQIADWWQATAEERADLMALVDEVRAAIEAQHQPDGFNVGFNAGAAAGQTVEHLQVHVIPRYLADVPDPRGGIRHVVPARGNYLAAHQPDESDLTSHTSVLVDGQVRLLLPELVHHLPNVDYDRVDMVVSFIGLHLGRGGAGSELWVWIPPAVDAVRAARIPSPTEAATEPTRKEGDDRHHHP